MTNRSTIPIERRYELLLEFSQRIRATLDLDEILEHLLDEVHSVVRYDAAGIFVLNRSLLPLRPGPRRHVVASVAERGFDGLPEERHDAVLLQGRGIIGRVIRSGETVILPDVRRDPDYIIGRRRTRSEVAIPILHQDQTIGALNLESDRLEAFGPDDIEILRFFADAAAIAIERAMLHRRLMDQRRIEDQLRIAQEVQSRLLPTGPPELAGYEIDGLCIPTFEIGGDYFDYIGLEDGRLALVIADVSGKGVPAALSMSAFRSIVRAHARLSLTPEELTRRLNTLVPEATAGSAYVTCVYGVLDATEGRFAYVNCGHNAPLLLRADGTIESLDRGGLPLGTFPDARLESGDVRMFAGDTLVFYTDGVVETTDAGVTGFFGLDRLLAALQAPPRPAVRGLLDRVVAATRAFARQDEFPDDFTLMGVRRL